MGSLLLNSFNVRICSYNCRGYNDSKKWYVCELLNKCDFLFLQEHWLSESQLSCLSVVSNDHIAVGVSLQKLLNVFEIIGFLPA